MARTVNDFSMQRDFPPPGKYQVSVISAEKGFSSQKKTPQLTLVFSDGESEFDDNLYVTEKTVSRLAMVAKRVCGMDDKFSLPDGNLDAAKVLANYIFENVKGKRCIVKIEENEEFYVVESGPEAGRSKSKMKRRVAFNGYERYTEQQSEKPAQTKTPGDDLPF